MFAIAISLAVTGCGGGGSSSGPDFSAPPTNPGTGNDGGTETVTPDLVIVEEVEVEQSEEKRKPGRPAK